MMSGVAVGSSSASLFHRALLFSLAMHLATLAWVQAPVWNETPPLLVINAHLEPSPESAVQPLMPIPAPTPAPIPVPVPVVSPLQSPVPVPMPVVPLAPTIVVPVPAALVSPVATPAVQPVARPVPLMQPITQPITQPMTQPLTAVSHSVVAPRIVTDGEWYPARKLDAIPRRLGGAQPKYPESAQRRGVTGNIKVRLRVNALGEVEAVEIVSAQPEGVFDAAAHAFFLAARYQPPQREGRPVRTVIEERITFRLQDEF